MPLHNTEARNLADQLAGESETPSSGENEQSISSEDQASSYQPDFEDDLEASPVTRYSPHDIHAPVPESSAEDEVEEGVSDELLAAASQYGMTEQQAKLYGNDEALRGAMLEMDRQILAMQQQRSQQTPRNAQQQQAPNQTAADEKQPDQSDDDIEPFEIDEYAIDPGAKEVLDGMQKHYLNTLKRERESRKQIEQRLAQAEQVAQQFAQAQQQRAIQEFMQTFDQTLEEMDDFKPVLGEGPSFRIPPQSPQALARQRVLETASQLLTFHAQQGRQVDPRTAIRNAVQIVFPNQTKQSAKREVVSELRQRQSQFVSRPTQRSRQRKASTPEENAYRRADEFAKTHGLFSGEIGGEEIDVL